MGSPLANENDPHGEVWRIAVRNAVHEPDSWAKKNHQQKIEMAHIVLSPFVFTDEMLENFIRDADEYANK